MLQQTKETNTEVIGQTLYNFLVNLLEILRKKNITTMGINEEFKESLHQRKCPHIPRDIFPVSTLRALWQKPLSTRVLKD